MAVEGAFLIQSISNFMTRLNFSIENRKKNLLFDGGNGGVTNKKLKNSLILTGKQYVVQIFKRKQHTKLYWLDKKKIKYLERFKFGCMYTVHYTAWYQDHRQFKKSLHNICTYDIKVKSWESFFLSDLLALKC